MAIYSLVLVRDGTPIGLRVHRCEDDLAALDIAYTLSDDQAVEIWRAGTRITQIKQRQSTLAPRPHQT